MTYCRQVCVDKASSGMLDKPCHMVKQYCGVGMFAAELAKNCPRTCNKCPSGGLPSLPCSALDRAQARPPHDCHKA